MATEMPQCIVQLLACTTAGEAKPIIDELVRQLCDITELDLHPALFLDEHATMTAQGKAVSPTTAAQCAEDVQRTRIFMQGVYAAIQQKLQDNNHQPINVLYAGTGPFGLLLIPLLPLLDAAQVRVTLLDIHVDSLTKLQGVIDALAVGHFIVRAEYEKLPELAELLLPDSLEKNSQGIYHLKRLWHKTQLRKQANSSVKAQQQLADIPDSEWLLDRILLDQLGVGLEPAMQQLYSARTLVDIEYWLASANAGTIAPQQIERTNSAIIQFIENKLSELDSQVELPLNDQQLAHWDEQGYLIVPGVLSASESAAARAALWEFLQMREDDPVSWYQSTAQMQKIMVQLFAHPALEVARTSDYIRRIFQQLWQRDDLVMSTDRMSFNPPETPHWHFPGPGIHWDVELTAPIPFGTQALIYLTDVAEDQGAFCCVPGFHKQIDNWLAEQPRGIDLQQQDWSQWPIKPIAAKAGDLIIWHQALPHGSSPNRAHFPRMVQYLNMYR